MRNNQQQNANTLCHPKGMSFPEIGISNVKFQLNILEDENHFCALINHKISPVQ